MNPQSPETPGLNLPPPVSEALPSQPEADADQKIEQAAQSAGAEKAPTAVNAQGAAMPAIQLPPAAAPLVQQATDQPTKSVVPIATKNSDLIDKEWVNKAKKIIEQTRDDPRKQTEELTVVKADYLKQQYNKIIKVSE